MHGDCPMKVLADLVARLRGTGEAVHLSIHSPCPAMAAIAAELAENVPGCWQPRHRPHDEEYLSTVGPISEYGYVEANFRTWLDRSRRNLGVDTIDLVQLHCPPSEVIDDDATYDVLDRLVDEQVIAAYGVSVETADQALSAIARPNVASVQIILNAFRMKPLDEVLPAAQDAGVGIIARVPLASGLLSGKYGLDTTFAADDHRTYNRDGSAFDVGETFSGVDYATGVEAAQEFARMVDRDLSDVTPAQAAIAWVCQLPGVTTVIPGARNEEQARSNAAAGSVGALPESLLEGVASLYDERIREQVHGRW